MRCGKLGFIIICTVTVLVFALFALLEKSKQTFFLRGRLFFVPLGRAEAGDQIILIRK